MAPLLANLICGSPARNHDFDFARWRLSEALYAAGDIRTDAFNDYEHDRRATCWSATPLRCR